MKKLLTFILACLLLSPVFSQGRMVINDNAYVVIDNGAFVVLDNPNANALSTAGTGGNIISEDELDVIRWNIGTGTGTYTVPFTNNSGVKMPLSVNLTAAGAGSGNIIFSTYAGGNWDNSTYPPSDVTHMTDVTGSVNNSPYVIDRFWRIDANTYSTKPAASISFGYVDAEHTAAGNTITEANLAAQRFNNSINKWYDWLPAGVANTASNVVSGVNVAPADFFKSWTLVDNTSPLPVELTTFEGTCNNGINKLTWTTETEVNNDYFTLEKSSDGENFTAFQSVPGKGNSSSTSKYEVIDQNPYAAVTYYRLRQTDFDGTSTVSEIIAVNSCEGNQHFDVDKLANNQPGTLSFDLLSSEDKNVNVQVFDTRGKLIADRYNKTVQKGRTAMTISSGNISKGIYYLRIFSDKDSITKKVFVAQ